MNHPIQPLIVMDDGVVRFKANAIVRHLLEWATARGMDLNQIAFMPFSKEDEQQFAQLIGYSLSGYGELSYVDSDAYSAAEKVSKGFGGQEARIYALQTELNALRSSLREPIARLFDIHPDALGFSPETDE